MDFIIFLLMFTLTMSCILTYLGIGFGFASNLFDGEYKKSKFVNKIILGILILVFLPEVLLLGIVYLIVIVAIYCDNTLKK